MVQLEEELATKPHNLRLTPATHVGKGEKTLTRCPSAFPHAPWHIGTHIYINTHTKLYKSEKI